ncbi:MAG: hypothetical protein JNK51_01875 [Blastocatellia bacterium]|nr:hypothetical protein [Chloracidobacterium sp.]MBL8183646.1 hypothetical protein [Blastocatellia bacterium]HRJ89624.1 hypothetical protein [Pyrinomonadaceae bacterium]HRK52195.1 hypothetical protein [Pyrinomonadaceae bacterium]
METKPCTKCGSSKPLGEFPKDARLKTGLSSQCRACHAIRARRSYLANREERLAKNAAWAKANPAKIAEYNRKRYWAERGEPGRISEKGIKR